MQSFEKLLDLQQRNTRYNGWFHDCDTFYYFFALQNELEEIKTEILEQRKEHLEDELWDLLWNYLTLVAKLHDQGKIDQNVICEKAYKKFSERMPYLLKWIREDNREERTRLWDAAKSHQKSEKYSENTPI